MPDINRPERTYPRGGQDGDAMRSSLKRMAGLTDEQLHRLEAHSPVSECEDASPPRRIDNSPHQVLRNGRNAMFEAAKLCRNNADELRRRADQQIEKAVDYEAQAKVLDHAVVFGLPSVHDNLNHQHG